MRGHGLDGRSLVSLVFSVLDISILILKFHILYPWLESASLLPVCNVQNSMNKFCQELFTHRIKP